MFKPKECNIEIFTKPPSFLCYKKPLIKKKFSKVLTLENSAPKANNPKIV